MGNYSGTTRCGYCGESGHNKAGCPKLKARIERLREEEPNNYMVRREDEKAAKRTARATGKRVCAYCQCHRKTIDRWDWNNLSESERDDSGCMEATAKDRWGDMETMGIERDTIYGTDGERGVGHSIRACKYRKADIAERTSEIKCSRVNHMKRMIDNGIGPGATVVFADDTRVHSEHSTPGAFAITAVHWHHLGLEAAESALLNREVMTATHVTQLFNPRPEYGMVKNVTLPANTLNLTEDDLVTAYRSSYTDRVAALHTRATEAKIRASIPFGWADAADDKTQEQIMDTLMADVKSRSKKK